MPETSLLFGGAPGAARRLPALPSVLLGFLLALAFAGLPAPSAADTARPLLERVTPEVLAIAFPGADRIAPLEDGGPTAAAAFIGDELAGYVFSTLDVLRAPGFSSIPFDVVARVGLSGRVTGATVLSHREPYILNDALRSDRLDEYLVGLAEIEARIGASDGPRPEYVAGATISARSMRTAVREAGDLVLRYRTGAITVDEPTPDTVNFKPLSPDELIAEGAVARVVVTNADLQATLEAAGKAGMPLEIPPRGGPDDIYIDFRAGVGMAPTIGRNSAGRTSFERAAANLPEGGAILIFGSKGRYDFLGHRYRNASSGFRLDRIRVLQGDSAFTFHRDQLIRASAGLGTPAALVILPPESGFDPLAPWRAELLAHPGAAAGDAGPVVLAALDHQLPEAYILRPAPPPTPAWMEAWIDGRTGIMILCAALAVLTLMLALQHRMTRSRKLHRVMRVGFLLFTLV